MILSSPQLNSSLLGVHAHAAVVSSWESWKIEVNNFMANKYNSAKNFLAPACIPTLLNSKTTGNVNWHVSD